MYPTEGLETSQKELVRHSLQLISSISAIHTELNK